MAQLFALSLGIFSVAWLPLLPSLGLSAALTLSAAPLGFIKDCAGCSFSRLGCSGGS